MLGLSTAVPAEHRRPAAVAAVIKAEQVPFPWKLQALFLPGQVTLPLSGHFRWYFLGSDI